MIIPGANGLVHLSIPIIGGRNNRQGYKEVLIDHSGNWQRDHFRTITSVYGKSAWGLHYFNSLEKLFSRKEKYLFEWNLACLDWICSKCKIQLNIIENMDQIENHEIVDFTDKILPSNYQSYIETRSTYFQVFEDKMGFQPNMSSMDLLMNEGSLGSLKFLSYSA